MEEYCNYEDKEISFFPDFGHFLWPSHSLDGIFSSVEMEHGLFNVEDGLFTEDKKKRRETQSIYLGFN